MLTGAHTRRTRLERVLGYMSQQARARHPLSMPAWLQPHFDSAATSRSSALLLKSEVCHIFKTAEARRDCTIMAASPSCSSLLLLRHGMLELRQRARGGARRACAAGIGASPELAVWRGPPALVSFWLCTVLSAW